MNDVYAALLPLWKEQDTLYRVISALHWDMETHMPPKAIEGRAEQLALMEGLHHRSLTDAHYQKALEAAQATPLDPDQARNVELALRSHQEAKALSPELVQALSQQRTLATHLWKEARAKNDFSMLAPELEKLVSLVKAQAAALAATWPTPPEHPLDPLLDQHEKGMTARQVKALFEEVKAGLLPLMERLKKAPVKADRSLTERPVPLDAQEKLSTDIAQTTTYDFERGRVDAAAHPFSIGDYDDVRITTRYLPNDFTSNFFSVMHECGHAVYGQNLPRQWQYQPLGNACSTAVHESQSRLIENLVGRSLPFWQHYLPRLQNQCPGVFDDVELVPFVRALNRVQPSLIRVEADEVTYGLHVILRFEVEYRLFGGEITVQDLPAEWNRLTEELLGIQVTSDADGVMQDIHWPSGAFGYFPTYLLGNLYNGQMWHKLKQELPQLNENLQQGQLAPVVEWLKREVHQRGNRHDPAKLIEVITGEPLNPQYFLDYLNQKYDALFELGG